MNHNVTGKFRDLTTNVLDKFRHTTKECDLVENDIYQMWKLIIIFWLQPYYNYRPA